MRCSCAASAAPAALRTAQAELRRSPRWASPVLLGGVHVSRGLAVSRRRGRHSADFRASRAASTGSTNGACSGCWPRWIADPARASERYEALRLRLVRVFTWERQADAESLADQAMDRVARRVDEGVELVDVAAYAHRVAELILLEARRAGQRREAALDAHARLSPPDRSSSAVERRHACLEACLARLQPDQRDLILRYYIGGWPRAHRAARCAGESAWHSARRAAQPGAAAAREAGSVPHRVLEPAGSFGLDGHNRVRVCGHAAGASARAALTGRRRSQTTGLIETTNGGSDSSAICSARWTSRSDGRSGRR